MSGHSKWHSIKHKKGAADAKRGKIFTKHAKLITLAARGGGDPEMNPALRLEIERAKAVNMPNVNIERSIKKGTGEDKESVALVEVTYEAYGPVGTALLIQTVTDNKNRTVANVKAVLSKNGGSMGGSNSVAYLFDRKGIVMVSLEGKDADEAELAAIDAGAEDTSVDGDQLEVTCETGMFAKVKDSMTEAGYQVDNAEISFIPKNEVHIDSEDDAKKVLRLMEALEDDDDVTNVSSNFDIPEEILERAAA